MNRNLMYQLSIVLILIGLFVFAFKPSVKYPAKSGEFPYKTMQRKVSNGLICDVYGETLSQCEGGLEDFTVSEDNINEYRNLTKKFIPIEIIHKQVASIVRLADKAKKNNEVKKIKKELDALARKYSIDNYFGFLTHIVKRKIIQGDPIENILEYVDKYAISINVNNITSLQTLLILNNFRNRKISKEVGVIVKTENIAGKSVIKLRLDYNTIFDLITSKWVAKATTGERYKVAQFLLMNHLSNAYYRLKHMIVEDFDPTIPQRIKLEFPSLALKESIWKEEMDFDLGVRNKNKYLQVLKKRLKEIQNIQGDIISFNHNNVISEFVSRLETYVRLKQETVASVDKTTDKTTDKAYSYLTKQKMKNFKKSIKKINDLTKNIKIGSSKSDLRKLATNTMPMFTFSNNTKKLNNEINKYISKLYFFQMHKYFIEVINYLPEKYILKEGVNIIDVLTTEQKKFYTALQKTFLTIKKPKLKKIDQKYMVEMQDAAYSDFYINSQLLQGLRDKNIDENQIVDFAIFTRVFMMLNNNNSSQSKQFDLLLYKISQLSKANYNTDFEKSEKLEQELEKEQTKSGFSSSLNSYTKAKLLYFKSLKYFFNISQFDQDFYNHKVSAPRSNKQNNLLGQDVTSDSNKLNLNMSRILSRDKISLAQKNAPIIFPKEYLQKKIKILEGYINKYKNDDKKSAYSKDVVSNSTVDAMKLFLNLGETFQFFTQGKETLTFADITDKQYEAYLAIKRENLFSKFPILTMDEYDKQSKAIGFFANDKSVIGNPTNLKESRRLWEHASSLANVESKNKFSMQQKYIKEFKPFVDVNLKVQMKRLEKTIDWGLSSGNDSQEMVVALVTSNEFSKRLSKINGMSSYVDHEYLDSRRTSVVGSTIEAFNSHYVHTGMLILIAYQIGHFASGFTIGKFGFVGKMFSKKAKTTSKFMSKYYNKVKNYIYSFANKVPKKGSDVALIKKAKKRDSSSIMSKTRNMFKMIELQSFGSLLSGYIATAMTAMIIGVGYRSYDAFYTKKRLQKIENDLFLSNNPETKFMKYNQNEQRKEMTYNAQWYNAVTEVLPLVALGLTIPALKQYVKYKQRKVNKLNDRLGELLFEIGFQKNEFTLNIPAMMRQAEGAKDAIRKSVRKLLIESKAIKGPSSGAKVDALAIEGLELKLIESVNDALSDIVYLMKKESIKWNNIKNKFKLQFEITKTWKEGFTHRLITEPDPGLAHQILKANFERGDYGRHSLQTVEKALFSLRAQLSFRFKYEMSRSGNTKVAEEFYTRAMNPDALINTQNFNRPLTKPTSIFSRFKRKPSRPTYNKEGLLSENMPTSADDLYLELRDYYSTVKTNGKTVHFDGTKEDFFKFFEQSVPKLDYNLSDRQVGEIKKLLQREHDAAAVDISTSDYKSKTVFYLRELYNSMVKSISRRTVEEAQ